MKRKFVFISNLFPDTTEPYRGLDNATVLHQLRTDFEIRAIALRPALPFRWRERQCREQDREFSPLFIPAPYVPKIGSQFNHLLMARVIRAALLSLQKTFPFEVVLASWIYPDSCAVARLAGELKFPFVAVAQGSDVHQYLRMPARRRIISSLLPRAAAVITRSGELGRLLHEVAGMPREKLHTVYNGVDLEQFRPGNRDTVRHELGIARDARVILFVGNFYDIKNPLLLVQAHADLCKLEAGANCQLVMIGGGPLENDARELARASGIGDRVTFAGRKNSAEVARYMQAADVLCLPSKNEGVPNVILEAFASGLRVIASRVGGIPEVLAHGFLGRLVEPDDLQALVLALAEELAKPAQTNAIRAHGLHFSWERAAGAYRAILENAIAVRR